MHLDADFLRMHLDYTFWANARALETVRDLSPDDPAFRTLLHVFEADRIWLSRTTAAPRTALADPGETWTADTLTQAWDRVANGWRNWVAGIGDVQARLHYRNLAGQEQSVELWEMVLHVVNHGSYHRGQVATMLRQAGRQPVATDFHVYRLARRNGGG
jgi:uncharacterized damage-inducible protein DinB